MKISNEKMEFLKRFKDTKRIKPVFMSIMLVSYLEEYGGERFYLFMKSQKESHISISLYRVKGERVWEYVQLKDGKAVEASRRRELTKEAAINAVYEFIAAEMR